MVSNNPIEFDLPFAGMHVVILGLARQGKALARFLAHAGAHVTVSDLAAADQLAGEVHALDGLPIRYVLGSHPTSLLDGCDLLCLSGGVPPQLPIVQEARQRGIALSNDSLLTCQLVRMLGLGPLIAVTGSSGKTTTTTLIGHMLEATGLHAHVGGNIGLPLLDRLDHMAPQEPLVLELSSFQLELFDAQMAFGDLTNAGPDVAALLNITPNHLDRHPNMAAYSAAKLNMVRHMPAHGALVLNCDDAVTARLIPQLDAAELPPLPAEWRLEHLLHETRELITERRLTVIPFSRTHALAQGAWLDGDTLMLDELAVCARSEVLLPGEHNISNLLAAMATVSAVASITGAPALKGTPVAGVRPGALEYVARTFTGVPHRLEIVAQDHEVTWINDSIATSPERALAGLRAVADPTHTVILLAGGKDKNLPWDDLAHEIVAKVDFLIGFGQFGPNLVELVQDRARYGQASAPNCAVVQRLDEAVGLAGRIAQPKTIVLLSPGGTSYDMYRDFEARGEHFRQLVRQQVTSGQRNGSHQPIIGVSTRL